jgi:hypothetical protein
MRPAWFTIPTQQEYEARFGRTPVSHLLSKTQLPIHQGSSYENEDLSPIPWDQLWEDNQHWLPLLLAGKHFAGRADFEPGFGNMRRWWFGVE